MKHNRWLAVLALLCAFAMLFSLLPAASFADGPGTDPEAEEEEELSGEFDGKLVIGGVDPDSIQKRSITISTAEEFEDFARSCRSSAWCRAGASSHSANCARRCCTVRARAAALSCSAWAVCRAAVRAVSVCCKAVSNSVSRP